MSLTSARVGDGAVIMLSIICVAVITGTPASTQAPHDPLLHVGHVLQRAFDAEVAAGDHHRVGGSDDLVEVIDRRERLDLGDQSRRQWGDGVAHLVQVVGAADEGDSEEVGALRGHRRGKDEVLGGRCLNSQPLRGQVNAWAALGMATAAHLALGTEAIDAARPRG